MLLFFNTNHRGNSMLNKALSISIQANALRLSDSLRRQKATCWPNEDASSPSSFPERFTI